MTVSPPGKALACNGDQLELMCSLTGRVLEWNVILLPEDGSLEYVLDSVTQMLPSHTVTVNSVIKFIFTRVSPPNSQPLTSRLVISQVNSSIINGTVVNCADRETRSSSSTIINVITDQTILGKLYSNKTSY